MPNVTFGPPQEKRKDTIPKQNRVVVSFWGDWDDLDLDVPRVGFEDKIIAPYPEEGIDINFSSNWENDFQNAFNSSGLESLVQKGFGASAQGAFTKILGASNLYTWKGVDPVEVSMTLEFVTHSDPVYDVIQPAFQMASTQLPNALEEGDEDSVVVKRPVEVSGDSTKFVTVDVGTWLSFPAVLPTNASPTFSGTLSTSPSNLTKSFPQKAEVDFEFIGSVFPQKGQFGFDINTLFNDQISEVGREIAQETLNNATLVP